MNTETKWQAVKLDDLRHGDTVRLNYPNGSVIHGKVDRKLWGDVFISWWPNALVYMTEDTCGDVEIWREQPKPVRFTVRPTTEALWLIDASVAHQVWPPRG